MARQYMGLDGVVVNEQGDREYMGLTGVVVKEDIAVAAGTNRLLMINPPGLDGGFGTGLSL